MELLKDNKMFLKNITLLAFPIIIQEFFNSSVNIMDTFMIGRLGDASVAAVGLANQIFFLFTLILFGIMSGASIFMGQYYGKNDIKSIYKVMGICITVNLFFSLVFFFGAMFIPEIVMSIYSDDREVIELGVGYLKIVSVSYFLLAFTVCINGALKSMNKVVFPMITTFISLICNVVFNYIFIFVFEYGVQGAAMGTLLARMAEFAAQILIIHFKKLPITFNLKEYFKANMTYIKEYFKITIFVLINEFVWAFGMSIYNVAYKYSGTEAQAAIQIANTIQNLFMVFGLGVGFACGILIANFLGAGNREKAIIYSRKCLLTSIILSIVMALGLILIIPFIIMCFNVSNVVCDYTEKLLLVVAAVLVFKTFNYSSIVGVLRSGGDTKFGLFVDTLGVWLIGVPFAFLGSALWGLPIYVTFMLVSLEEVLKFFISGKRVLSNKWANTLVE